MSPGMNFEWPVSLHEAGSGMIDLHMRRSRVGCGSVLIEPHGRFVLYGGTSKD
jgi:hypothetical protein